MLKWTAQEKVLLNMKRVIAAGWRMDSGQLDQYRKKLVQKRGEILPGYMGSTFLVLIGRFSALTVHNGWMDLLTDTEQIQKLIKENEKLDRKGWRRVLAELEARQESYFRTELGSAFLQELRNKLQNECETEAKRDCRRKAGPGDARHSDLPERAAVTVLFLMSMGFLSFWLYEQAVRNENRWNIQQMKSEASRLEDSRDQADARRTGDGRTKEIRKMETEQMSEGRKNETEQMAEGRKDEAEQMTEERRTASRWEEKPEILPQYKEMSETYTELFGWLQIPNTQIDLPVMRHGGEDRDFYLHHDFTGEESVEGTLFVDQRNSSYPMDDNTVVYGHNMKNGHIFGMLKMYGNAEFFREHREIHFDTLYETGVYEAVAVIKTRILKESETGFRYYQFFHYENQEEFQECLDFVEQNRIFETGDSLQYGDQVLMLSTCEYSQEDGRLVVVAKRKKTSKKR